MHHSQHRFHFDLTGSYSRLTTRKVHIRRLYDLLHLSLQRNDRDQARRAWAILVRCPEVDWNTMWPISLDLIGDETTALDGGFQKVRYLRDLMGLQVKDVSTQNLQLTL